MTGHLERGTTLLRDLLTTVTDHLLTGMILQVVFLIENLFEPPKKTEPQDLFGGQKHLLFKGYLEDETSLFVKKEEMSLIFLLAK